MRQGKMRQSQRKQARFLTDWQAASITHATARHMMVRGQIEREAASGFTLTDQGAPCWRRCSRKGSDDFR
jgi:hypothetical protein